MSIRVLPQNLINQIAAGEVIERPASALKELIENALDAGATSIEIHCKNGGKSYFSVTDNGLGMDKEDLALSIQRHATSKLPEEDLFKINYFGFRGEALASIASVARLTITSRKKDSDMGYSISVQGGQADLIKPASISSGTVVEVRDLFFATPARLKFLKSDASELQYIKETIKRLAMVYYRTRFVLTDEKRTVLQYPVADTLSQRVSKVIGNDFAQNTIEINLQHEGMKLQGFVGLPTYTRATAADEYLFVNNRFIKDKMLAGVLRGAYQGLIGHTVYPVSVLFLTLDGAAVDVNVHPAKTEVRFAQAGAVRGFLIASVRNALSEEGHRTATTVRIGMLDSVKTPPLLPLKPNQTRLMFCEPKELTPPLEWPKITQEQPLKLSGEITEKLTVEKTLALPADSYFPPMGLAKAQIHKTYILAQTENGLIVVDQHAAHERLTYEKIRAKIGESPKTQLLLIPEMVDLEEDKVRLISEYKEELDKLGLVVDVFGLTTVVVREVPAVLQNPDLKNLIKDLADTLMAFNDTVLLQDKIKEICAKMACHGSIRAGREMTIPEMNALLRQMEECGTSGQCIHGRPTYVELKLPDIERLFGRR